MGNFKNRMDGVTTVLTESGTNEMDDDRKDWSEIFADKPIGDESETYGQLVGADLGARVDAIQWVETDGTFRITMNGSEYVNIVTDFTTVSLGAMTDIAAAIENSLRVYFPNATCQYEVVGGVRRFKITSGKYQPGSVGYLLPGLGGTDISGLMQCTAAAGATVTDEYVGEHKVIRTLYVPEVANTDPVEYAWHWTHFPIYRTGSLVQTHVDASGAKVANSPDMLILAKELRIGAAFYARRINGYIESRFGKFEEADVGSTVEFEGDDIVEITEYINENLVKYDNDYYGEETDWHAAAIGGGSVIRVSQTGNIVTRLAGDPFVAADARKPIWWPSGEQSYIRCFIDADHVRVWDENDRNTTGITIGPYCRNFCDTLSDPKLFARSSGWALKSRFMLPLAVGNMASLQPGFLLTAVRGMYHIDFCQIGSGYKQFIGYHVPEYQRLTVDDQILDLIGFPLRYAAMCLSSIHRGVTNNAQIMTIPETNQIISIPSGLDKVANFGSAIGSVQFVNDNWVKFITNTNEVRTFNGEEFGLNEASNDETGQDKCVKALQSAFPFFTSIYSRLLGYLSWWKARG